MPRGLTDADVAKLLDLGMSDRARRIDTHVRFVDSTVYDGRPDFDDDECGKPLSQRRPCVIYKGVENAIQAYGDMMFGAEGFPRLTSAPSENDKDFEEDGLSEKESAQLDYCLGKIVDQARLRLVGKQILAKAQAAGAVAVLVGVRAGKLRVSTIDAKNCEPEFDKDDPERVTKLVISYRYVTTEVDPQDQQKKKHVWQYRRVIDDKADVTFKPVEILRETQFPVPSTPGKDGTVKHGFGFCPIVWYAYERDESEDASRDGHPIHEGLLTLVDAINQSLSQRHRAAIYCGDPQVIETGVTDDDVRVPMAGASTDGGGGARASDDAGWNLNGQQRTGGTSTQRRKKGASTVWRYESEGAKVTYLFLPAGSLDALDDDADDCIAKLRESLSIVHIDPDKLTGSADISGKTLAFVCKQQIAACNSAREDVWTGCLLPLLGMLLRVVLKVDKGLYLPSAKKLRPIVERYEREVEGETGGIWFDPPLRPMWPEYFEMSPSDEQALITTVKAAKDSGLVTDESATAKLAPAFKDIKDHVAYAEGARKQADEKAAKQQAALHNAVGAIGGKPGGGAAAAGPKPGVAKPAAAGGAGRSGGAAPGGPKSAARS